MDADTDTSGTDTSMSVGMPAYWSRRQRIICGVTIGNISMKATFGAPLCDELCVLLNGSTRPPT